jgi:hypothetical protein
MSPAKPSTTDYDWEASLVELGSEKTGRCFYVRTVGVGMRGAHARGYRVARASGAPSRDALRGILRGDTNRAWTAPCPRRVDGYPHEEHGHAAFKAAINRSTT